MTATSTTSHLHDVQVSTPDWPTCGLEVRREHLPCLRHDRITASDGGGTEIEIEVPPDDRRLSVYISLPDGTVLERPRKSPSDPIWRALRARIADL